MEQNAGAEASMTPVVDSKQKSGNGLKIATAIACIVAICGIGFGVYGMMQSLQKDNQISDLKVQIKDSDGNVTTLETEKIETNTDNGTITIVDSAIKENNADEYFYIGDWGLKIKIGEDYKIIKTAFFPDDDGERVGITVVKLDQFKDAAEAIESGQMPYLNFIKRSENQDFSTFDGTPIEASYSDGEYYYFVYNPTGIGIFDGSDQIPSFVSDNTNFAEIIKQSSNYSSI